MISSRTIIIVLLVVAGASCGPQRDRSQLTNPLLLELKRCGMDISKANLVEVAPNERYVALRGHPKMKIEELDCVAGVLVHADYGLRSDGWSSEDDYQGSWKRAFRKRSAALASEWLRTNRPNAVLSKYVAGSSIGGYVESVERWCGAPSGTARFGIEYKYRYILFPNENPGHAKTDCVEVALTAGLVDEDVEISRWRGVP